MKPETTRALLKLRNKLQDEIVRRHRRESVAIIAGLLVLLAMIVTAAVFALEARP